MKYYLHDSNSFNDEKIYRLFMEFGYEGLGLFYTFLEKIAIHEKPMDENVMKSQLKIRKKLEKIWDFMKEIGLISIQNGDVFNENLLNFSENYQIKKEKTRKRVSEWRDNQKDVKNVTHTKHVRNTHKVKESKVKEIKEKYEEFVFLKDTEYQTLIDKHGKDNTDIFIEVLNNYKQSNGKTYKSDYGAINNWVVDRVKGDDKYKTLHTKKKYTEVIYMEMPIRLEEFKVDKDFNIEWLDMCGLDIPEWFQKKIDEGTR